MMALAPLRWAVAPGKAAVVVAYDQRVPDGGGDGAGGVAVVEDGRAAAGDHAVEDAVAQQATGGDAADRVTAGGAGMRDVAVLVELQHHVEVGSVAAAAVGPLVIEEEAA